MKKLILFITALIICIFSAIGQQSVRAYDIEGFKRLEAKRAFVLGGDSVYATTKMVPEDTTVVTELYLQAEIDSASIPMQEPDSIGQFPVWNPDSGFFIMDNVYNYATQTDLQNLEHSSTNNLGWTVSGHTDGVNKIAAFDATGAATTLDTVTNLASQYDLVEKVTGPASSTDNAAALFSGTTGKLIKNSNVTISYAGAIVTPSTIQGTTLIPTNVSNNSVPYKTSTGLQNSKITIPRTSVVRIDTGTSSTYNLASQIDNSFEFTNQASASGNPTLSARTSSRGGFTIVAGTMNANLNSDMEFRIAEYDNTDYDDLTRTGFLWRRSTSYLMNLRRNGNLLLGYISDNLVDKLQTNGSIQATTAKLTNLSPSYFPVHTDDATGLVDGNVFQTGGKMQYATSITTFDNDNDIPNVGWVSSIAVGNSPKLPVDAATTGNITLSGTQTIDGYAVTAGMRVLVKNQSTASQNGVYTVASGAWTRTTDLDTWAELYKAYVAVLNGTISGGASYVCTIASTGTLETDPVTWILYLTPVNITVSSPLAKLGNNISLGYDTNTLDVASNLLKVKDNVYQPLLNGTGFIKASGTTISYDNSTYLTTETDPIFAADSANLLHWSDTLNVTKGIASQYDLAIGLATKQNALTTGNLTEGITGLEFSSARQVIGGATQLNLTTGYFIPTTTEQTNWNSAYTNRITSLTTTGNSGVATLISNILNVPNYTLAGLGGVPTTRTITINGTSQDLSANRSWSVGTVTNVVTGLGLSGGTITNTGTIAIDTSSTVVLSRQRAANTYQPKGTYLTTESDPVYSASSWFSTTNNSTNWNTAYTDRNKWDGGATGLVAATGRTSLGGTTIGQSVFTSTNPSAITFLRANADNTVSWLNAADFRTAIGVGTGTGTVTSVSGTGSVNGITLSGTVTTSGSLTLGGSISGLTTSNLSASAGITNSQLANSSVTVNGNSVSLGGSTTVTANTTNALTLKVNTGTTEGTNLYTFNGSAAKTLDIKSGSNVSFSTAAGSLTINSSDQYTGTVTSVGMTVPTGFSISGSPITNSGTLGLTYALGYSLPTTASQSNWDAAYGWGNHAVAGYLTQSSFNSGNADLAAIEAISGTTGLLRKTAANTWSLDNSPYLTSNQTITLSGNVTGSGTTSITTTIANSAITASMINATDAASGYFLRYVPAGSGLDWEPINFVPQTRTLTINGTTYDLSANRSWTVSASPAGSNTQVQYNNLGSLGASANFTFNSGTGVVTATNFQLGSDRRYKIKIRKLSELEWVDDIQFVSFRMKQNKKVERYGVVAQQVEKVNPNLVSENADGYKAVSYTDLLIAKVARQDEQIKELTERLERLEKLLLTK